MAYERILRRFRECVRTHHYVLTIHAEEEMSAEGYTVLDVEQGVMTGRIVEKQKDEKSSGTKYRVRGHTTADGEIELVAKLGPTGKMVVITVFAP